MTWDDRRRLAKLKRELAILEAKYAEVLNRPGETTQWVTAAMSQWGPRIADLKHDIDEMESDHDSGPYT